MDVIATENHIAGTLIEHTELSKDDKTVRITLCDDGSKLETAVTYLGVGTRVLYQGDLVVTAVRLYNDAIKLFTGEGFKGNSELLDGFAVAEKVLAGRGDS